MRILIAGLLFAAAVFGQSGQMRVVVPFSFHAQDEVLPAGEYRVQVGLANSRVSIMPVGSGSGLFLHAFLSQRSDTAPQPARLVFHKYGEHYFLRDIWNYGQPVGFTVPRTKAEREMARIHGRQEVAQVQAQ